MRAAAAALLLFGCAAARPPPPAPLELVAVLPVVNLSGTPVPLKTVQAAVEAALAAHGIAPAADDRVDEFLEHHRVRWTGGVDAETARAAGAEIGVTGIVITTVEVYDPMPPPRFSISMRLVAADESARIRWIDGVSSAGDESPGLFDLGIVRDPVELEGRVLGRLAASLESSLEGRGPPAPQCSRPGRFRPRASFRSPDLDAKQTWTVAVLPFVNETAQRSAGEILALQFARQLEASGRFRVVEPGIVRADLLRFRIVMEGGVSLDVARIILELARADFVLAGTVRGLADGRGAVPSVEFSAMLLDRKSSEVVWAASSWNQGDDGVFFFDAGAVATGPDLACRVVSAAVGDITARRTALQRLALPARKNQ